MAGGSSSGSPTGRCCLEETRDVLPQGDGTQAGEPSAAQTAQTSVPGTEELGWGDLL